MKKEEMLSIERDKIISESKEECELNKVLMYL